MASTALHGVNGLGQLQCKFGFCESSKKDGQSISHGTFSRPAQTSRVFVSSHARSIPRHSLLRASIRVKAESSEGNGVSDDTPAASSSPPTSSTSTVPTKSDSLSSSTSSSTDSSKPTVNPFTAKRKISSLISAKASASPVLEKDSASLSSSVSKSSQNPPLPPSTPSPSLKPPAVMPTPSASSPGPGSSFPYSPFSQPVPPQSIPKPNFGATPRISSPATPASVGSRSGASSPFGQTNSAANVATGGTIKPTLSFKGKAMIDALKQGEKSGPVKVKIGQPRAPANIFEDPRRSKEQIEAEKWRFSVSSDQILLVLSFFGSSILMFGTVYVVWKLGAIHFNEY